MTTLIPFKKGVRDPVTGQDLTSFESFEHQDTRDGGEYLMVTMSDEHAARLGALLVRSIGTEPIADVLDDPDLIEALERLPDDG